MVRLGFIAEGATEKIILQYSGLLEYLASKGIAFVTDVVNAEGNGNLLPHNIERQSAALVDEGATDIVILTDLDEAECITHTKKRISPLPRHTVIVSVKAIEAWFLADTAAMRSYLNRADFFYESPETVLRPYDEIKSLRKDLAETGVTSKKRIANAIVHKHGFSILRAAEHPNCPSAKYFLNKIAALATQ